MNFDALLLWLGWSQLLNHHYLPSMYLISRHFDEWWFYFWPQMHNIIRLVSDIRVNYHLCIIDAPQIKCDFFFKIAKSKFFQALIKLWHSCSSFASVIILILEGLFISHNIPIGILRCNKNIGTKRITMWEKWYHKNASNTKCTLHCKRIKIPSICSGWSFL